MHFSNLNDFRCNLIYNQLLITPKLLFHVTVGYYVWFFKIGLLVIRHSGTSLW